MVLKDHKADKHSSRKKALAAIASRALQRHQEEEVLPSNAFRFQDEAPESIGDDIEAKLREIAEDTVSPVSPAQPQGQWSTADVSAGLGFEQLSKGEAVRLVCDVLGFDVYCRAAVLDDMSIEQ